MTDNPSWGKQVASGLRLALTVVGVLLLLGLLIKGLLLLRSDDPNRTFGGIAIISLVCVLAFVTTSHWAKWFFGVCCLLVLRGFAMFLLGRTVSVPSIVAPRSYFALVTGIFVLMAVLSYRFVDSSPNWLDSLCLVGTVVTTTAWFINNSVIWLLAGVVLLGLTLLSRRLLGASHSRVHAHD
jgi:hypothetical protein